MRIASWLASGKAPITRGGKREPQAKHLPGPGPTTGGTSAHSSSTAPISPGAIRIPARQVQRKPAEAAHLSQPAGAGVSNQPQPIQLGGNQGGHSRDPLNRRGCVVVQSHPREPPRQPRHPQLLAGFQGPADQDIFSNGRHSPSSSRHSASDPRKWPREYLLFTVPAN
ncbi:hypothetical protein BASA83_007171 [Batrachochytrium salamandrivorans]|nr:hypothetical protein BASA83_007171 [Batrachochytrium salamandrivorans]